MPVESSTLTQRIRTIVVYLPSRVRPTTKLEIAQLIIKRKPCNVYLASAFENAWGNVEATPVVGHHHVRLECPVKFLVRADSMMNGLVGYRGGGRRMCLELVYHFCVGQLCKQRHKSP